MHDVAQRARVSKATVSHVINNTRFVEEETKQRVLQAIAALDYRPNAAARSLTTNRTGSIGMVISDACNLFFGEMLRGVEDILRPQRYGLIVCNTDEVLERESHYLDLLLSQPVDGIIAAATSQPWSALAEAEDQHTPIVFVDRAFEHLEGAYVGVDNHRGAYIGTRHLLARGHRRIGIIAGLQRLSTMRERLAGFRQALAEQAIPLPDEWVMTCELNIEAARRATRQILTAPRPEARPTALFLNNNLLSLGALLAVQDLGLRCPQDVALLGFDDHPWAAVSDPPLTVISQPARQVGQVAAQMLLDLLQGRELPKLRVLLDCELIVRASC
jgi:LacI family transcriptional regulator